MLICYHNYLCKQLTLMSSVLSRRESSVISRLPIPNVCPHPVPTRVASMRANSHACECPARPVLPRMGHTCGTRARTGPEVREVEAVLATR